ncbi:hypothetical protein INR49_007715 [Caranx melampygus]|nr:hypothetical protein INR49_007715 [Caranx melampygus]
MKEGEGREGGREGDRRNINVLLVKLANIPTSLPPRTSGMIRAGRDGLAVLCCQWSISSELPGPEVCVPEAAARCRDECDLLVLGEQRGHSPPTSPGMIFVGRMTASSCYSHQLRAGTDEHKVKDLGSLNGTFVNDVRIQEQMYITLKLEDKLSQTNILIFLQHEKFTSGLQLSKKPSNGETTTTTTTSKSPAKTPTKTLKSPSGGTSRSGESRTTDGVKQPPAKSVDTHKAEDRIGGDVTALPRGTPLYGQPSWWGDGDADDENSFKQETKSSTKKHDSYISGPPDCCPERQRGSSREKAKEDGLHASTAHDSSYFEIPTKEGHMANNGIHEIPTKDTEGSSTHATTAQGHASFTIEFDNTSPGKVTIKDHVSKFSSDHHRSRSKKSGGGSGSAGGRDLSTLQAAMMASESKVADWLAQNDPTLVRSESTEDDSKSIKSDVPVHLKRLKGGAYFCYYFSSSFCLFFSYVWSLLTLPP